MCRIDSQGLATQLAERNAQALVRESEHRLEEDHQMGEGRLLEGEQHRDDQIGGIPVEDEQNAIAARGLADADDGQTDPPEAVPQPATAEATAHRSKRENRREREEAERARQQAELEARRQAEEQARQAEEQRRIAEEQAAAAREAAEEQQRMGRRAHLFGDDELLQMLNALNAERNAEARMELIKNYLWKASEKLIDFDAEVRDQFGSTITDTAPAYKRMSYYVRMMNPQNSAGLFTEIDRVKTEFADYEKKKCKLRTAAHVLVDVLKEEFAATPEFELAIEQMGDELGEEEEIHTANFHSLEDHIRLATGLDGGEACGSNGPFHYITRPAFEQQVNTDVLAERTANPQLSEEQALDSVFARYREEKRAEAEARSVGSNVVPTATQQQRRTYGEAEFARIETVYDGAQMVAHSDGMLYMKPVGDGLVEIRPTIPKEVTIDGQQYPIRRDYIAFHKALMRCVVDENGRLKENAATVANFFSGELSYSLSTMDYNRRTSQISRLDGVFPEELKAEIESELGSEEETAALFERMKKSFCQTAVNNGGMCGGCGIIPSEILRSFTEMIKAKQDVDAAVMKIPKIVAAMQEAGAPREEIESYITSMTKMLEDANAALIEYRRLNDLDIDGEEIPLPQACSANGLFYRSMTGLIHDGNETQFFEYRTMMLFQERPQMVFDYVEARIEKLRTAGESTTDLQNKLDELRAAVQRNTAAGNPPFGEDESAIVKDLVKDAIKYDYHVGAHVGDVGSDAITVEMFAPEATTYTCAPFSTHSAIGKYHQGFEGMKGYYNADKAIVDSDSDAMLLRVNHDLKEGGIPGL